MKDLEIFIIIVIMNSDGVLKAIEIAIHSCIFGPF